MRVELILLPRVAFQGREIAGPRLGNLLALLAEDLRSGCGTARLVDGLWPDEQPEHPTRALQVLVSRARAQLGPDTIASTPVGYRLALTEDQVDASALPAHASTAARCAQAADHAGALAQAEAGLALWDPAPSGPGESADPLSRLRAARAATYRALVRTRALALCHVGRRPEAAEILAQLITERPRDEEVLAQLLLCEADTLGPSAALARYDAYRRRLREKLGSDPGPELQQVYATLLEGAAPSVRRGVVHEPNALLGREDDVAAVHELLRVSRVVSIIGPGGLGKTRMAHAVAGAAQQRVVQLVALAGATADDDVAGEVASALGIGDRGNATVGPRAAATNVAAGIAAALGPAPALLVLDNCEHVLPGASRLVRELVAVSENIRVLTTSRAPLGLSSESVYLLPELSLATSVELFRQRARAARPGVGIPEDTVRQLCARLDGLPLAVELAAARVRVMSVAEIARRLDDRFTLLRGAANDAPERHRTLHAVIDWSWNLLGPPGRAALRALSIFPGGFTAEAARPLLGADADEETVWAVLEQLVDQSLLQAADAAAGTRFRMLETVREFSAARRREAGEADEVVGRFLGWVRDFGVAHHASMFGPDLVSSAARTRDEQENLLLALRLGIEREDDGAVAAACALLGALWIFEADFARIAGLTTQSVAYLARLRPEPAVLEVVRTATVLAAVSALILGHPAAARALVAVRRLAPAPPDTPARATALVLATLAESRADQLATLESLGRGDEPLLAAMADIMAGFVWQSVNDPESALRAARRTLAVFDGDDERRFPWFQILTHSRIGELCLDLGRGDEAHEHFAATLALLDGLPGLNAFEGGSSAARVRSAMVMANLQRGAVDEAEHWLELTLRQDGPQAPGLPGFDLVARAEIRLARGEIEEGLGLWRQAAEALPDPAGRPRDAQAFQESWRLEVEAMTVIAHAQHDRLAQVGQLAGRLPGTVARMIAQGAASSAAAMSYADYPVFGMLLLTLALLDLDRGRRAGDARATRSGARMVALAERFRFKGGFHPTMSGAVARRLAEEADEPAYAEAASAYAGLDADALRAVAAAAAAARAEFTGPDPS